MSYGYYPYANYAKNTWAAGNEGGTPITAAKLNAYESAISDLIMGSRQDTKQIAAESARVDALESWQGTHTTQYDALVRADTAMMNSLSGHETLLQDHTADLEVLQSTTDTQQEELDSTAEAVSDHEARLTTAETTLSDILVNGAGGSAELSVTAMVNDGSFTVTTTAWFAAPKMAYHPDVTDPGDITLVDPSDTGDGTANTKTHGGVMQCNNAGLYIVTVSLQSNSSTNSGNFFCDMQGCSSSDGTILNTMTRFPSVNTNRFSAAGAVFLTAEQYFKFNCRNATSGGNSYVYPDGLTALSAGTDIGFAINFIKVL